MAVIPGNTPQLSVVGPKSPWPGVRFFCTTRSGGYSAAPYDQLNLGFGSGDLPESVRRNRQTLRLRLPADPCWLKQVHGTDVFDVDRVDARQVWVEPQADASTTSQAGRVLAILTADCLPVIMANAQGSVLGAAHAGWRGLASGVLEQTFAKLRAQKPDSQGWRAWIGPGIGPMAFQVGSEVREIFTNLEAALEAYFFPDPMAAGKWLADLSGLAQARLRRLGVEHIESAAACTVTDPERRFFSYRREGQTGRMATLAWLQHD